MNIYTTVFTLKNQIAPIISLMFLNGCFRAKGCVGSTSVLTHPLFHFLCKFALLSSLFGSKVNGVAW